MKLYSLFVSQAGSIMFGFAEGPVVAATQSAVIEGTPFMLKMKSPLGYSIIKIAPDRGGLTLKCNIAQDGDQCYEVVPVDANGNPCNEAEKAGDIAPAQAGSLRIVFLPSGASGAEKTPKAPKPPAKDVPDIK